MVNKAELSGRARDAGKTRLVGVELSMELVEALESVARRDRRTKRAVVELALEEYMRNHAPELVSM